MSDDEWKEYRVHDRINDEHVDQDDIGDRDIVFKLFQTKDDDDIVTEEYKFPQFNRTITLRGTSEITNSTGLGLWRGAEILASFLANRAHLVKERCILELGAGQGLCGLVAHHLGASKVVLTDGDTNVLDNLRHNVTINTTEASRKECKISCPQLIWGRNVDDFLHMNNDGKKFHVLIATDVNYMASSLNPFWKTASQVLEPDTGIMIYANVSASQCSLETILSYAKEYGFEWETAALDVYLLRLIKK
jgi:16S rRNA G966 N2-methylase RsmD